MAAIKGGVPSRVVCVAYGLDALTVRHIVERSGQTMPVDPPGPNAIIANREAEMLRRALAGEDFSVIGRSLDVSREWVRLVVKRYTGLRAKDLRLVRKEARGQFRVQRARDLADANPDLSLDEVARDANLTIREVEKVLGPAESARRRRDRNVAVAVSRDQILNDMRAVSALPGGIPLSGPFYDAHRGVSVSSQRVIQVFGTWTEACVEAGVTPPKSIRGSYTQQWSRDDCLSWVRTYLDSTDKPTFAEFDAWLRGQQGAPSSGTVRLRCGKWIETVRDAYTLDNHLKAPATRHGADIRLAEHTDSARTESSDGDSNVKESEPEDDAQPNSTDPPTRSTGQGPNTDIEMRQKIEAAAQDRLVAYYQADGWQVEDTHLSEPFDAIARKNELTLYLEAKGTQSSGDAVLVTRGEVEHARTHRGRCFMGIWSGIEFNKVGDVLADAGNFRVIPFDPDVGDLTVVNYQWRSRTLA